MLVSWQDSSDSDGLAADGDRLLVAGVGDHAEWSEWIINIRTESDTYNGRQQSSEVLRQASLPLRRDHIY